MRGLLFFVVMTVFSTAVFAAENAEAEISFFGIDFNKSISIPECHYTMISKLRYLWRNPKIKEMQGSYSPATSDTGPCYQRNVFTRTGSGLPVENEMLAISYPITQEPTTGKNLTAYVLDGKIQRIEFDTDGIKTQSIVLESLISKLGNPKNIEKPEIQTLSGAKFNSIIATWELANDISAAYVSAPLKITEGGFIIGTRYGISSYEKNFSLKKRGTEM